ncbi:MAG TPA: 5-formyltetrahydrofolate cyclo-ligase [Desulfurococcales archaeon]|nr:5-formyltetrahydrofolate cyclo-ligase [Desulfurococcales archaeon]
MSKASWKEELRNKIWGLLEERGVAKFPKPVYGRIPNFHGSETACIKASLLDIVKRAKVVKVDPDSPLREIRRILLLKGKTIVMPTPRLRNGFIILDGRNLPRSVISEASTIKGAFRYGKIVIKPQDIPRIDVFIVGSVVVSRVNGVRLGKGGGYSDLEYAILLECGSINREVPIITVVHDLQVLDVPLKRSIHDVPVDTIVTPTRIMNVIEREERPIGIIPEILNEELKSLPIVKYILKSR